MKGTIRLLDFVYVAGVTQCLFFSFLLFKNRKNRYANRFLAMVGITVSLIIGIPLLNQTPIFNYLPFFLLYLICSPLMIAPFIFLYTKFLISPNLKFKMKDGIHFLLFLLWFLFISIKYIAVSSPISEFFRTNHMIMGIIMWINIGQTITYHIYILYILKQYSRQIKESFSSIEKISLRWLKTMIILGIIFGFFMLLLFTVGPLITFPKFDAVIWLILAMIVMVFVISYLAIRQPEIFQLSVQEKDLRKKYQTSGLSPEKAQELKKNLLDLMEREKPFLNNLLNISDLAKKLSVPPWYISQVINEAFNQNYFDFINKFRVEEAQKQLADSTKKHLSILEIAYDVGFNSKSTFNTAFKKYLKTTPSHFRRNMSQHSA